MTMIITRFNVVDNLWANCPSFRPVIAAFRAEYAGLAEDKLPIYILMGDLVRGCSTHLQAGKKREIAGIFTLIERWIAEGDKYVHDMAIVGFIEDLQNANLHDGTQPEDFKEFLGPLSVRAWQKVDRFWSKSEPILRD